MARILEVGGWSEGGLRWELRRGDFLTSIEKETTKPHLIFFDPYSPKVNSEMWTVNCFAKIRAHSRTLEEGGTRLFTYSQATRIRVAMIQAGFFVGRGAATGLKEETTEAATARELLREPLDQVWLERWRRSHIRHPFDCAPGNESHVDAEVEKYMAQHGS
jgi:queuine tRNA-ribosyltransferase